MREFEVQFELKSRYYIDHPAEDVRQSWMLLHGYAQLAIDLQRSFVELPRYGVQGIYPEGLSHFYNRKSSGGVGSSWMTKENRTMEIDNTMRYLSSIINETVVPDVILGFSQGTEMASRLASKLDVVTLVIWGGRLAPEVLEGDSLEQIKSKRILMFQGDDDEIYSKDRYKSDMRIYHNLGIKVESLLYQGGHETNESAVKILFDLLI